MLLKFVVTFDENLVSDEEIEKTIHKSLNDVTIVLKNNKPFEDTYEEGRVFKKILFRGRK